MKLIASLTWLFAFILSLFAMVPFSETKQLSAELDIRASRTLDRQSRVGERRKRSSNGGWSGGSRGWGRGGWGGGWRGGWGGWGGYGYRGGYGK
ncbi:glycine rich protein family domain-containing protein [Ditylenchus destructor]|nr:glycine rich protein family domain-containing protein [Ditylenchus destructor]